MNKYAKVSFLFFSSTNVVKSSTSLTRVPASQNVATHLQKEEGDARIHKISESNAMSFFQNQEERITQSEPGKLARKIRENDIEEVVKILESSCITSA